MPKTAKSTKWIISLGAVALLAILIFLSMRQTQQKYEVCMAFKGGSHCATAAGSTYEEAVRSAEDIDCQFLANGRDETMVCLAGTPTSVRSLAK
jgi:hypothetical protein